MPALLLLWIWISAALAGPVRVLTLHGSVDPGSADYIVSGIHAAEADGAEAVVLCLDTPGGLLDSARAIVSAELASKVPIVVYVSPSGGRAGSAGVFITAAAHVAAMAPGTTIGAAHPVNLFGGDEEASASKAEDSAGEKTSVMGEKILNDTLAWARTIAAQRGRDALWYQAAVRESVSITDQEALEKGVVDLISPDLETLLREVDGRTVQTAAGPVQLHTAGAAREEVDFTIRQGLVHFLGDPNVLFVLIGLGLLGLYIEFQSPGLVVPGVVGALCLVGAGVGLSILPFQAGGLLLILCGFVSIGLEAWIGGKGVFAVLGSGAIVVGGLLLFEVSGYDLRVDPVALLTVGLGCLALALGVGVAVARAQGRPVLTGSEGMVGLSGVVLLGGEGGGRVRVAGEDWAASWTGVLGVGAEVRVLRISGQKLIVEAAQSA